MTAEKYKNLLHFASILGITTAKELMNFKSEKNASTNQELYLSLYYAALSARKSVSVR